VTHLRTIPKRTAPAIGGRREGRALRRAVAEIRQVVPAGVIGVERHVAADEAFLLQHGKRALEGEGAATRATLAVIEYAEERLSTDHGFIRTVVWVIGAPRSVTYALMPLRMAKKLGPYRETALTLEPWRGRRRVGPPPPDTQSRRSADHRERHSYTSQGRMAGVVERISVVRSSFAMGGPLSLVKMTRLLSSMPRQGREACVAPRRSYRRDMGSRTRRHLDPP
jgi:hypothetical protein